MSGSMRLPRKLCDNDKTHGRVQVVNGTILYSPNCTRDLPTIPERDLRNIFRPTLPESNIRNWTNFSALNLTDYQSPRWWSLGYGWVAFVPQRPDFSGPVLGRMNRLPRREELDFEEGKGYAMPRECLQVWRGLENDVVHAVGLLCVHTKSLPLLPPRPTFFGYRHHHKSWRTALIAFERSRNWFVIWIAVLAYLIAVAETETYARKDYPLLALTDWYTHFVEKGCSEVWLEGLAMSSMVCNFSLWAERTGTFVSLEELREDGWLPRVEWLCAFSIPTWYIWKLEWSENPKYEVYAPLPHQLQNLFDGIPPQISGQSDIMWDQQSTSLPTTSAVGHVYSLNHRTERKRITWAEFKAERDRINTQKELVETKQQCNERLARERNPGTSTAKVFEWIPDDDGNLVRTKVDKALNEHTLGNYEKEHIRYDAFWHEWDCCTEMGEGGGYDDEDEDDEDEGEGNIEPNYPFSDPEPNSENAPASTDQHNSWAHKTRPVDQAVSSSKSNHLVPDNGKVDSLMGDDYVDNLEREILEVLRLHFGYTGVLPIDATCPIKEEKDQKKFMRVIGIQWAHKIPLVFERRSIQAAYDFINRLQSNAKILDDEWDLGKGNRESVYLTKRMACIRLLNVNLGNQNKGSVTWYMFDFGSARTKTWMFTVTSASVALTVCRLDKSYTDADLAVYFLQCGMSFRTMQLSTSLSRAPYSARSVAKRASRTQGYRFLINDFTTSEARAKLFLETNRRGRVACMMGGIAWRVACSVVNWNTVINGPSGWSPNVCEYVLGIEQGTSLEFIDDALTAEEVADLSGMYYVLTGKGAQYENPSWYPAPESFAHSGYDYGYWSEVCEDKFKGWKRKGSEPDPEKHPDEPSRNPINKVRWTTNLKGSAELRRARSRIEQLGKTGLIKT